MATFSHSENQEWFESDDFRGSENGEWPRVPTFNPPKNREHPKAATLRCSENGEGRKVVTLHPSGMPNGMPTASRKRPGNRDYDGRESTQTREKYDSDASESTKMLVSGGPVLAPPRRSTGILPVGSPGGPPGAGERRLPACRSRQPAAIIPRCRTH